MNIPKIASVAALAAVPLAVAAPAAAAIYIKMPDAGGDGAAGVLTIDGYRWEAKGATRAVQAPRQPSYKAEGGRLVRTDEGQEAGQASVQRLAGPLRKPERDAAAVLTRPVASGPGMLVVRGAWRECREGAAFPEVELHEVSGGGTVVLQQAVAVSCAGDTFALNYEKIK